MLLRFNKRRLALSLAIMGSMLVPVMTKSYKTAHPFYWYTVEEDDEDRYLEMMEAKSDETGPYSHLINWDKLFCRNILSYYDTDENKRKICKHAEGLRGRNIVKQVIYRSSNMFPILKDMLIGFCIPWIAIYAVFPFARTSTKKYLDWVMEETE